MNDRQLVRLGIALVVIVVLWAAVAFFRGRSPDTSVSLTLPRIDTTAVETIRLTNSSDTAVLTRGPRTRWMANGYPADSMGVVQLLAGLADTAATTELMATAATSHRKLAIDADSGTRVLVTGRGGTPLLDIVAGRRSPDRTGVFVRLAGEDASFILRGRVANSLLRTVTDWRDRRIAVVPFDSVGTVEVRHLNGAYRLVRATRDTTFDWTVNGRPADPAIVRRTLDEYRTMLANAFATPAQMDSAKFREGGRHLRILSRGGTPLASLMIDSTAGSIWIRADTGGMVFRAEPWLLFRIAPPESVLVRRR